MGGEGEPDDAHALHSSRRKLHVLKTIITDGTTPRAFTH